MFHLPKRFPTSRSVLNYLWNSFCEAKIRDVIANIYYIEKFREYIYADSANTYHHFNIKEALHIMWGEPILNKQDQHFDVLLNF